MTKNFNTLGTTPVTKEFKSIKEGINYQYVGKKLFVIGELVELQADGEVDVITEANPQESIGTVTVANTKITGDDASSREKFVTVITPFRQVVNAQVASGGTATRGLLVTFDPTASQSNGIPTIDDAGTAVLTYGIALETGVADAVVKVGVFYTPQLSPA